MQDAKIGAVGTEVSFLRQDFRKAVERITEAETRVSVVEDRVTSLQQKVNHLTVVTQQLAERVEDAEGRAR